jgi:AcrR family transcriptional regulator
LAKAVASEPAPSTESKDVQRGRVALVPQRSNGRERVALILQAAAEVIHERGYEAATMKEIAERSNTKIGSLYRFFPTKELVADALIQLYAESAEAQWQAIIAKAPTATTERLADLLLNAHVQTSEKHKVMHTLLESGTHLSNLRLELRGLNIQRIANALKAHVPHLKPAAAKSIAVIMFYNMRAMRALTSDPTAPNAPGASNELRASVRAYLAHRLKRKT